MNDIIRRLGNRILAADVDEVNVVHISRGDAVDIEAALEAGQAYADAHSDYWRTNGGGAWETVVTAKNALLEAFKEEEPR